MVHVQTDPRQAQPEPAAEQKPEEPTLATVCGLLEAIYGQLNTQQKQLEAIIWCLGGPDQAALYKTYFMAQRQLAQQAAEAAAARIAAPPPGLLVPNGPVPAPIPMRPPAGRPRKK